MSQDKKQTNKALDRSWNRQLEDTYPNIVRWVNEHEGWVEIGYDVDSPKNSLVRACDSGGMSWEGKDNYGSLDKALQDLDSALVELLQEIYGE